MHSTLALWAKYVLYIFFLPHLILLQPSLRVAGASEQRAFRRYKKAIPRALALTKFLLMEARLTPSPHVVTSCWLCPHHPFLYWYISTGTYCIHVNAVWKDKYQTGDSGERALWGALVILFLPLLSDILPSDVLTNWNCPHFLIVSWLMEKKPISFIVSFSVRLYDFIYCFR